MQKSRGKMDMIPKDRLGTVPVAAVTRRTNMNEMTLSRWLTAVATMALFVSGPALGIEEYSGAFYFGNSGSGIGIISPVDITNAKLQLAAGSGNYMDCKPPNPLIQDVDGDNAIGPSDILKIKMWVGGNMKTGAEGKAHSIEVVTPSFVLPVGATCSDGPQICVKVWDNPGLGNCVADLRFGWGVNFKVNPASECPAALLCGRDPTPALGLGKDQFIQDYLVFQYSGMDGPGRACIRVADPGGCGGKTVTIDTYVPDDAEALYQTGTVGRFSGMAPVAGTPITGSISNPCILAVTPDPASVNDGAALQMTATDTCDGNVTANVNTTWSVTAGSCTVSSTGLVTAPEGCSAASCTVRAEYNPGPARSDTTAVNVTDNEAGTWNSLSATTCATVNDPVTLSTACTTPNRISSADGCNRGAAGCAWSCAAGNCGELCMPTTTAAFTGRCTDGAYSVQDGGTSTNNETIASVNVTPEGPFSKLNGETQTFACLGIYADGCSRACAMTDLAGCGALAGGIYTCGGGPCTDRVSAVMDTGSDGETITCGTSCCYPPQVANIFPVNVPVYQGPAIPQRNWSNAHVNQIITPVLSGGATAGGATSVAVNCINAGNSTDIKTATCSLAGYPADLDVPCTPSVNFTQLSAYHCTATATNASGSRSKSGHLYTAEAATPADGGHAGGYIGGLNWDSTTAKCGSGTATITAIDAGFNTYIPGKVYVQYVQGATVREYYTSAATGSITVPVNCQPIDSLSMSYKCGLAKCAKVEDGATIGQYKVANTRNYRYMTFTNLDASLMAERMVRMGSAENGRWKSRITGTISETYFTNYIYAQPSTVRQRSTFTSPVHLRTGFTLATLHGIQAIANGLDALLLAPDYEVSVSMCLFQASNTGISFAAQLPPNLLLPELRRANWAGNSACTAYATNPGIYRFETWAYNPGVYENVWTLGAYANATNISFAGGLDLLGFPIYTCGMGMYGVTTPSNLTGDPITAIGTNAGWRYDLRESWGAFTGLGYDPDTMVNRKVLYSVYGRLPQDPARTNATLLHGTYRLPQLTDSALGMGWDTRFYRKNVGIIGGADFGLAAGIGITGLALNTLIDDPNFTIFQQGYYQSTAPKFGNRDLRMWSGGAGSQTVSSVQSGVNSTWTDPSGTNIDWTAIESGGPTNYAAIVLITRGSLTDGRSSDSALPVIPLGFHMSLNSGYAPGSIVGVWHVGPSEAVGNETIPINDFLNMPTTLTQLRDEYRYPAPQWSNTIWGSQPVNRNGELWRIKTAGAGDTIPKDASSRYYFQFTRPTMLFAAGRTIHQWQVSLDETADFTGYGGVSAYQLVPKFSIKSRVEGTRGATSGLNQFQDVFARFINQGVAVNDKLWINSRIYAVLNRRVNITSVASNTMLVTADTWGAAGTLPAGVVNVNYRVIRATRRGECIIDEYYGGGPDGYTCKSNAFWTATGPATSANIRVLVPTVTEGARTLNGVTGYVPSFWEGLANGNELKWTYSVMVFNTGAMTQGGLGGAWDWNNWDTRKEELATQHAASDSARVIRQ
jgi:hypothetical protein